MHYKLGVIGYGNMGSWHCGSVRDRIENLDVQFPWLLQCESI